MATFSPVRKEWADRYAESELAILNRYFQSPIRIASHLEDTQNATDLVAADGTRIAKRLREPKQIKFKGEVIFRDQPNPVGLTEWEKAISPDGPDYLLYSIASEIGLACWWILDLNVLRRAYTSGWYRCIIPNKMLKGTDDGFMVVKLYGMPTDLVFATSE